MTLHLPFRRQVEEVGRLQDRFGRRWFTVREAARTFDIEKLCRDEKYVDYVRARLKRLEARGLLDSMKHPVHHERAPILQFRPTDEARRLIDLYRDHAAYQHDLTDVMELL